MNLADITAAISQLSKLLEQQRRLWTVGLTLLGYDPPMPHSRLAAELENPEAMGVSAND